MKILKRLAIYFCVLASVVALDFLIWLVLLLLLTTAAQAETYTEFYIIKSDPTNNLNAGSTTDLAPNFVYGGGNWTNTTCTFRVASGNPLTDGVTNGAWASIYTTAGATVATCVGIVSNVTSTFITLDTNTVPSTAALPSTAVGATTCKVGGCWAGPNTNQNPSVTFPWAFMAGTMTNSPFHTPRFNFNTGIYSWTNAVTLANAGGYPMVINGYGTTVDDGICSTNDGTYAGVSFTLLTLNCNGVLLKNFAFINNGSSGTATMLLVSGAANDLRNIFVSNSRGYGASVTAASTVEESEITSCDLSGTTDLSGLNLGALGALARNVNSHHNLTGGKCHGFTVAGGTMINCKATYNAGSGLAFMTLSALQTGVFGGDFYSNNLHGIEFKSIPANKGNVMDILNCVIARNRLTGITNSGNTPLNGRIENCIFGSGTMTNLVGDISTNTLNAVAVVNKMTYPADLTPWVDPDNGNFSQSNVSVARARGSSKFMQLSVHAPTNTVSYPDVGATQGSDTNGAGGAYTFSQ